MYLDPLASSMLLTYAHYDRVFHTTVERVKTGNAVFLKTVTLSILNCTYLMRSPSSPLLFFGLKSNKKWEKTRNNRVLLHGITYQILLMGYPRTSGSGFISSRPGRRFIILCTMTSCAPRAPRSPRRSPAHCSTLLSIARLNILSAQFTEDCSAGAFFPRTSQKLVMMASQRGWLVPRTLSVLHGLRGANIRPRNIAQNAPLYTRNRRYLDSSRDTPVFLLFITFSSQHLF
jgi:hypothetical protein